MGKSKLILYKQNDINGQLKLIRRNNAFILPDGSFYLAKGYTGCNPSHQLESSALAILREKIGYEIKKVDCESYFLSHDQNYKAKYLYYLRSVLVHYYGFALFARQELINNYKDRNKFFDCSIVPNPEYYGKDITPSQTETLEKLFEINDNATLCFGFMNKNSEDILKKVLSHNKYHSSWHR